ncbi:ComEC/Rec2 family competence protein [Cryobacterium sp. SO1]|uniref:ComEC/Rec2 family competence protein n=1 Tax=Cryobacterium sp. SO1 TaxID=1897061 RepID=UPI001022AE25|nr:ComEC/Rec2 family competence protein [Cryobacterium sp. SO1]RZI33916.1 hypothetical protein BJQ95_03744 [Cryobacterium sp. SO1]
MRLDLRLAPPAAAGWASAGLLVAMPTAAAILAALLAGAAVTLVVWAALLGRSGRTGRRLHEPRRRPFDGPRFRRVDRTLFAQVLGTIAVCAAAAALAAVAVAVQAPARSPEVLRIVLDDHTEVTATLTVWSPPVPSAGVTIGGNPQLRFRATLTALGHADLGPQAGGVPTTGLEVPVVVFADAAAGIPSIGDEIRLSGTVAPTDPGDAAAALFFGRGSPETVRTAPWWLDWANTLRHGFADAAGELPGEGAGLLPGLAIGDTTGVSDDLDQAMTTSSLSHLTAVSGANCAIVLALVLLSTASLGLGRGARVAIGLGVLAGFVVLVTPEPSVVRAATMATIVLLSGALGRPGRGVASLALASLCLLVADPWLSRNYGFALSVLATLGLLVLAGPLSRRLTRWMPRPLAVLLAIPLAAQLACQPVLVLLSPTLPAYGVPANLLAAPAAPVATIVGLAACLLLPWLPWLSTALIWLAWLPATWIAAVAQASTTLPGSTLPWLGGPTGVLLTLACTAAVLVLLVGRSPGRSATLLRVASGALVCVAAGATVGTVAGTGLGRAAVFPATWQIAACDIGQGDAVLVRDGERVALVDVGPDPALLSACLDALQIDRVDLLVLTHYDLDHVGGLDAVLGRVGTALVGPPENAEDARLHAELAAGGATVTEAGRGDSGTLGSLSWQVLWPIRGSALFQTGNPGSVTIQFEGGGIRSLFLGDLGEESQEALRAAGPIGAVDVVKVAHHGSRDQSGALYAEIRASVGLVSVGADNGYGHPTQSILDILGSSGTAAFRTDQDGLVVVAPAGRGLRVWTEKVTGAG